MPQIGWVEQGTGKEESFEYWLGEAEAYGSALGFPYEVLLGMSKQLSGHHRPAGLSATMLLGCPRRSHIESLTDYYTDAAGDYPAFRGTIAHSMLEDNQKESALVEHRFHRMYRGTALSGQLDKLELKNVPNPKELLGQWVRWCEDMYIWEQNALPIDLPAQPVLPAGARFLISDWKSKHELPTFTYVFSSHQEQGNLYRWLCRIPAGMVEIEFVYVSMEGVRVMPLYDGGTFRNGRAKPQQLWTDEQMEEFLNRRMVPLAVSAKYKKPIAYDRVPTDDLWECGYCPVRQQCYELAAKERQAAFNAGQGVDRVPPRNRDDEKKLKVGGKSK